MSLHRFATRTTRAAGLLVLTASTAAAQYATTVVDFSPGPGASASFPAENIIGGPTGGGPGGGSTDVVALGEGGSITVGFDVTIVDGPGVDFTVFENAFAFGDVFAEVAFVEVSTDGLVFARFPARYSGPQGPCTDGQGMFLHDGPCDFTLMPIGTYAGLAGHQWVDANVFTNSIDPADPARSGGESFDLAELVDDPLVVGGQVDLSAIHFVRVVDVPSAGTAVDASGTPIWDSRNPQGGTDSADLDAIAVIQHAGTVSPSQPEVDLFLDEEGHLNLMLVDPDGDLDLAAFRGSFKLQRANRFRLANLFPEIVDVPNGRVWRTAFPVLGGLSGSLAISISDRAGNFSADQIFLP